MPVSVFIKVELWTGVFKHKRHSDIAVGQTNIFPGIHYVFVSTNKVALDNNLCMFVTVYK